VARWPDPASAPDSLKGMLGLCPAARLELHPVTRVVGNVLNEGPELIAAISEAGMRTS
jgi:putative SOS response-associated peptidase YedK